MKMVLRYSILLNILAIVFVPCLIIDANITTMKFMSYKRHFITAFRNTDSHINLSLLKS